MDKIIAARKGGLARVYLHGNPGTPEGRRRGGLKSVAIQNKGATGFKKLRKITFPSNSTSLAELLGILAGDGYVGNYQTTMTTNSKTDLEHVLHTKSLFAKLFDIPVSISYRQGKKACVVVVSSKEISRFLVKKGLVQGHKIRGNLGMPTWIRLKESYRIAFTRGLFDTDGCVYVDKHKIRGREYKNMGMAFTNRSLPLLVSFKRTLEEAGLSPTQKTKFTVFLRREADIERYFSVFGSSNPKHARKVESYFAQKRRGVRVV